MRELYYIGLTALRVLLHVYDYTRDPELDHHNYGDYIYQNTDLDLYSKFGNIVVAVMVIVLAMILYKQQKRNCREKFIHEVKAEEHKDAAAAHKPELYVSLLS